MRMAERHHPESEKVSHRLKKFISFQEEQLWADKRKKTSLPQSSGPENSTTYQLNRIKCSRLSGVQALQACNAALDENQDDFDDEEEASGNEDQDEPDGEEEASGDEDQDDSGD